MLILGAGGHAKEVLDVLYEQSIKNIALIDETISDDTELWGEFKVYSSYNNIPESITKFVIGVGNIKVRKILQAKAESRGLAWTGIRAKSIMIGHFDVDIDLRADLMQSVRISSSVKIGKGSLINRLTTVHHDVQIGDFCEIAPNVSVLGGATIGNEVFIGAGAQILPKVKIGSGAVVGAGAIVNKNVPENTLAVGNPVRILKKFIG